MRTNRRKLMASRELPSNYERLEYIENTSKAYIDCGLQPKYTFDYEIKAYVFSGKVVLGYMGYNDKVDYRFFYVYNNYFFDVGSKRLNMDIGVIPSSSSYYHVKFGNYYINTIYPSKDPPKVTDNTFNETMNGASIKNLFLFGESTDVSKGKVYFLKIKDSGKFIRYFIPVRRKSDDVIGMYDLVGRKFYTSPNGVAFTGG